MFLYALNSPINSPCQVKSSQRYRNILVILWQAHGHNGLRWSQNATTSLLEIILFRPVEPFEYLPPDPGGPFPQKGTPIN